MHNESRRDNRILRVSLILLILTLLSTAAYCRVMARYVVSDSSADHARAAAFDIHGDIFSVDLTDIEKPGDQKDYTLSVRGTSEVSLRDRFGITLDGSMPLTCTITKNVTTEETDPETGEPTVNSTVMLKTYLTSPHEADPDGQTSNAADLDAAIQAQAAGDEDAMPYRVLGRTETLKPNEEPTGTYTLHVEWPITENGDDDPEELQYPYGRSLLTLGLYAEQID